MENGVESRVHHHVFAGFGRAARVHHAVVCKLYLPLINDFSRFRSSYKHWHGVVPQAKRACTFYKAETSIR